MTPWITGWTQPGLTIRNVLATNPRQGFWQLIGISALSIAFSASYSHSLGSKETPWILFLLLFGLTFCSCILNVYFMGWVLKTTGRFLGGSGSSLAFRAVTLWSSLPNLLFALMWVMLIMLKPHSAFILNANHNTTVLINLIGLTLFCWQFYLLTCMVREVQGFGLVKTLINLVIAYLFVFITVLIVLLSIGSVYFLIFHQK